jgi:hypothetical protein
MKTLLFTRIGIMGFVLGGICAATESAAAAKGDASLAAEVEKYITGYFDKMPGYAPGYLITQEQAAPLLGAFQQRGWNAKMLDSLASRMVSNGEFLARIVDSPEGRKFMKQIAKYPQGYDRLDRLSRLPLGQQLVHDLIYGAGGYTMIEYLTTTSGGNALGKLLSNNPNGEDFNRSTGRIYTVPMLVEAFRTEILKKSKK